ncbi:T9SS type A sorting domain-containing protein [Ascidiimonas aurantiaca]|uniref:T9SS type A sorting domain-containing protein n=1 Tax=Ascidiimonas aurantiaca TaxID=1685432 RepID=UPI0030EF4CD0
MNKYEYLLLFILGLTTLITNGQTSFCQDDPPLNPWLADSPYPIYHRNSYGQASSCIEGIQPNDSISIKMRRDITGGTSPWIYLSDEYPNGERTILYSNSTHIFKFIDNGSDLVAIDSLRLDFNTLASNGYNHLLTKNKIWFSYEPTYDPANNKFSELYKFSDADTTNPYSPIIALDTLNFGDYGINRVNMYNINYNGEIVWYSEKDPNLNIAYAGVIDQNFNMLDTLQFSTLPNERVNHNSISVDENNTFYIVTSHRLIAFAWDGIDVTISWEALYDFVNDGPTGNFAYGSGTTPTLMGWGDGNDKLVVVADGHANNNLVAFWRELPNGWTGIPGMPLHFADSITIPNAQSFGNLFQSIENSPTAFNYDIAIAQFNGFLGYGCDNEKGVSKFRWNETNNNFQLEWTNNNVNMNGVLTYSSGSNLVYGTGKELDCNYYYYGLNWDTGNVQLRYLLGQEENFPDDPFYDQGVNHIIDEDGSIYYSGSRSLVKLQRHISPLSVYENEFTEDDIKVYPNPTKDIIYINGLESTDWKYSIYDIQGKALMNGINQDNSIAIKNLKAGIYFLKLSKNNKKIIKRVIIF